MNILIGIDDSPYSEAALEFARTMSWPSGTRVLVASAITAPVLVYVDLYVPSSDTVSEMMAERRTEIASLVAAAERRLRDRGLETRGLVLDGDPRIALLDLARRERVDLILVGSHGRTGLTKLVMGSVASHVVTHAPCSVLVVRTPEQPA